uniref:Uncharacterized protein n=1 Tax=viral metagenome TaxID=1070528 RepID=A0A6C0ACI6_9ZZZZ
MSIQDKLDHLLDPQRNIIFPGDDAEFRGIITKVDDLNRDNSMTKEESNNLTNKLNELLNRNIFMPPDDEELKKLFNDILGNRLNTDILRKQPIKPIPQQSESQYELHQLDPFFPDPINYNDKEEGVHYIIKKKRNNKKKIVSGSLFRTFKRNNRLPEYLSGLLCTINNIQNIMGGEWGYRLYFDDQFLKRDQVFKKPIGEESSYSYKGEFNDQDINKWMTLFEGRDEGEIFNIFLSQLNNLDYVELFNVKLKTESLKDDNGYPVGLIGTNYRFHASLDQTKDLVYMIDADISLSHEHAKMWKSFENSSKSITYLFIPNYKPPTHALTQYPFSIIAYFWGIKPSKYRVHYSFDDIFTYFLEFNDNETNFLDRTKSSSLKQKGSYGSDEIILTDLIFGGFKNKDLQPLAIKFDFNPLLLFYSMYVSLMDSDKKENFNKILSDSFIEFQSKIKDEKNIRWNVKDLQKFLFGEGDNKFCCLLPLFNSIPNKKSTKYFYMSYISTLYDMVESKVDTEYNFRDSYYLTLIKYMKKYSDNKMTNEQLNKVLFNHVFSQMDGWSPSQSRIILPNNTDYLFNRYYNSHPVYGIEGRAMQEVWGFIISVINKSINLCDDNIKKIHLTFFDEYAYPRNFFFEPYWGFATNKDFEKCVANKALNLIGGYGGYSGYGSVGTNPSINCESPEYNVKIKQMEEVYYIYKNKLQSILMNNNVESKDFASLIPKEELKEEEANGIKLDPELQLTNTILLQLLNEIELKEEEYSLLSKIYGATLDPRFHSTTWKLLECIINIDGKNNFFMMDSGNSLSLKEYGEPSYPWDDDIDIGYADDENYTELKDLMRKCLDSNLVVGVYKKLRENIGDGKWHTSDNMRTIILKDKSEVDNFNPENIWFIKVSLKRGNYEKIKKKIGLTKNYSFGDSVYSAEPWIDIMPYIKTDGKLVNKNPEPLKLRTQFVLENDKFKINDIELTIPTNIIDALNKYKPESAYTKKTVIYSHINKDSFGAEYTSDEMRLFMIEYIKRHGLALKDMMKRISCDDFTQSMSGGSVNFYNKYKKYKAKYFELKKRQTDK